MDYAAVNGAYDAAYHLQVGWMCLTTDVCDFVLSSAIGSHLAMLANDQKHKQTVSN